MSKKICNKVERNTFEVNRTFFGTTPASVSHFTNLASSPKAEKRAECLLHTCTIATDSLDESGNSLMWEILIFRRGEFLRWDGCLEAKSEPSYTHSPTPSTFGHRDELPVVILSFLSYKMRLLTSGTWEKPDWENWENNWDTADPRRMEFCDHLVHLTLGKLPTKEST